MQRVKILLSWQKLFVFAFLGLFSVHVSAQDNCSASFKNLLSQVESAETLTLKSSSGEIIELPGHNFYRQTPFEEIPAVVLGRGAAEQARLDAELTEQLARLEMSFAKKNPQTGNYDKIFKVPVNGGILPLSQQYYDELVLSTEPVMRGIRDISQRVFSEKKLTPKNLGVDHLPQREQEQIVKIIEESIYFEKALVAPQMKDYPFFSVVGFDAALGRLDKVTAQFFEFNSGTPSGLSNNIQLLELIRKTQPELYEKFRRYLKQDETFRILKETIDDSALSWTGRRDGISVIVGPGVYNGAHPDVSMIAHLSGMPLVQARDMYVDAAGHVRLNTGVGKAHPVVTGIYGRVEESFFLQDTRKGVAWKVPDYLDNPELGRKWGHRLEAGVAYDWKYDKAGQRIGVNLDSAGQPRLMESYDQMGVDPARPNVERGSFVDAILNKKLYFSGLGGRVVDDKRLFEYVSKYVAPKYTRGQKVIAGPPRTLRPEEYDQFYSNPEPWVVKAPDMSGGAGIHIMPLLDHQQRRTVVESVKKDISSGSDRLSIQEFAKPGLLPSPQQLDDGSYVFGTRANDLRLFVFMDSKGRVRAGNQSFLLRVANAGSGSTNTSQGAGYGIAIVADANASAHALVKAGESVLLRPAHSRATPLSVQENIQSFASILNQVLEQPQVALLDQLIVQQRALIDVLGSDYSYMISRVRDFKDGEIGKEQFLRELFEYRSKILKAAEQERFDYNDVSLLLRRELQIFEDVLGVQNFPTQGAAMKRSDLRRWIRASRLPEPVFVRENISGPTSILKYETGILRSSQDSELQKRILEAQSLGAEIRLTRSVIRGQKKWLETPSVPYFRVEKNEKPIVGIDLTQNHALAALDHEIEHLRFWHETKQHFIAQGFSEQRASRAATEKVLTPEMRVLGERRSLDAEKITEYTVESPFNKGPSLRAREITETAYISRELYPHVEGFKEALIRKDTATAESIALAMLEQSHALRSKAVRSLESRMRNLASGSLERMALQRRLDFFQAQSSFEFAFDGAMRSELASLGLKDDFMIFIKNSDIAQKNISSETVQRFEAEFHKTLQQMAQQQQQ
jgi:uncharacterized circularly permuted ATP-grasp superfamily protein